MADIDMISLQVVMNALHSITDEMNLALVHTAYSTNIKDRRDCSCAIYTAQGEVIAQTELGSPIHLGIMPSALDSVLSLYPIEAMHDGDHILVNTPYPTGPGHLNDVTMVSPVFVAGKVAFLVANMAHHVDVGGYAPGSMAIGLREIYQEGLQIPPVKLVKRGVVDQELLAIIKQNVRTSREVDGDIHAQMACNNVGRKRLDELAGRQSLGRLNAFIVELFNYSERRTRAGLAAIKPGRYCAEDFIEGTPNTQELIKIRAEVTVGDGEITFDFAGTDAQINDSFNSNKACAISACYYIVKALIDPGLPPNVGSYRPIRVLAPQGCVLNANPPAAIGNSTIIVSPKIVDVLLAALVHAIPERAAAASNGVTSLFNVGGTDPRTGELYNYVETYAGGQGAMQSQDGMDAVQCHMTNTRNTPVEVMEIAYPVLLHSYGLVPDSEGPGKFRGGVGMRREMQVMSENTMLTVSTDRSRLRPWGVNGGGSGGNSSCTIAHADGQQRKLPYSKMTTQLATGDIVTICTPGAGGWGDPWTRDVDRVLWDVREELVSVPHAAEKYGVVVKRTKLHGVALDVAATTALRASRNQKLSA